MSKNKDIPKEYWPEIDELPGDLSHLAEIIESVSSGKGVEATLAIAQEFRGTTIYCHNVDTLKRTVRNRRLIKQYTNGSNVPDLAREVGLSIRQAWSILGKEPDDKRHGKLI